MSSSEGEEGEVWDLSGILRDPDAALEELKESVARFKKKWGARLNNITPELFLEALKEYEGITVNANKLLAYYELRFCEDSSNKSAVAKHSRAKRLSEELSNELLFFQLWFVKLSEEDASRFLESEALKEYRYYLELLRKEKPYVKSEEVEKALSLKSVTSSSASTHFYELVTSNFKYSLQGRKGLSFEEMANQFHSPNPAVREAAYKEVLSRFAENSLLLEEIYRNIATDWYLEGVKIRGFKTPISVRNHSNDLPDEAVESLLEAVRENAEVFQEYFKLKHFAHQAKGAGYPYSRFHLYAPHREGKEYPYAESKELVLDTYKEFDERFYQAALKVFKEGRIHSKPYVGKRSGAFCYGVSAGSTPYVLLNHTGSLRDVFTMAHELGHAIHDLLAGSNPDLLFHAALPMAETASVMGEMLLAEKLLSTGGKEEKVEVLMHLLDNQYATIARQAYFTLFEKEAHQALVEGAEGELVNEAYHSLVKEHLGDLEVPDLFKHEWKYVHHFFESPFYCYAYSWGNLLVLSLYSRYKEEGSRFKEAYAELLSKGGSESPVALLGGVGVKPDKEFWEAGFKVVRKELELLKSLV